jgi:peptidyl-prolyl cis-trans isomerase SurA
MNRFQLFLVILTLIPLILPAQIESDEILMTIHDRKITAGEFERIYRKNNSNTALEQQSVEEYLELFVNFKLKVIEAEEQGLDTTSAFRREFNGYKAQLAKPYLSDKEEIEIFKKEAFERAQKELNVNHILIRLADNASPEDTSSAWDKAIGIRDKIIAGEEFGVLARATSDDPSAKTNSGNLGWFTVFRMIYPFETAAYNTPKGQISLPVRTRFGYHLIQVLDERPAQGEIRVAHIMVMVPESMTENEKIKSREKIYSLHDSIKSGMDFSALASKYSEDRGSASQGGELPWFGTGRMVMEFENAAFKLKEIGDVSEPVKTAFGWHIIKLLDRKVFDDYEKMEADLQNDVTKSDRNMYARKAMISRIKKSNDYMEYPGNLQPFYNLVDSSIFHRTWDAERASGFTDELFKIGDRSYGQDDFTKYLNENQGGRIINIEVFVNSSFEKFSEESVLKYAENQLPEKYPDFRHLVQEYHDGILLFDLTDKMVWSRAVSDTAGLEAFYEENKDNYKWEIRMDATLYTCRDRKVAEFARGLILNSRKKTPGPETIVASVIEEFQDSTCIIVENRKFEKDDHSLVRNMDWKESISGLEEINDKTLFLVNNKILKPEARRLDESRGIVTADYQNQLEKQWIQLLRQKYEVIVNRDILSKIK